MPSELGTATILTSAGLLRWADFSAVTLAEPLAAGLALMEPLIPRIVMICPARRVPDQVKSGRWAAAGAAPKPAATAAMRNHTGVRIRISAGSRFVSWSVFGLGVSAGPGQVDVSAEALELDVGRAASQGEAEPLTAVLLVQVQRHIRLEIAAEGAHRDGGVHGLGRGQRD